MTSGEESAEAHVARTPSVFSSCARALGLGVPLLLVVGASIVALTFVAEGASVDRALSLIGQTALLAGAAIVLALPLALALVARAGLQRRRSALFSMWGAVPPVVTGVLVGLLFTRFSGIGLSSAGFAWAVAVVATSLAILPRLVLDVGTAVEGSNAIVLIDAALALGARRTAALRLALAGELGAWRSVGAAAVAAIGDGVAVLAALALVGGSAPDLVGVGLLGGGNAALSRGAVGLCICLVLAAAFAAALRAPIRVRAATRNVGKRSMVVSAAANVEGLR